PARRARTVEAIEDEREVLLGDPGPVIADRHRPVADSNLDRAARRAPLRGVIEEVRDGPFDGRRNTVDERLPQVRLEVDAGLVAPRAVDRIGGDEVEANVLWLVWLFFRACELDQPCDPRPHLADLLDDVVQE